MAGGRSEGAAARRIYMCDVCAVAGVGVGLRFRLRVRSGTWFVYVYRSRSSACFMHYALCPMS
jgi:hypothetical protein